MEELFNKLNAKFIAYNWNKAMPTAKQDVLAKIKSEILELLGIPIEPPVKPEIADIVKNILHEGVNIAMYGNPFESEEGIIKEQEKLYDEAIKNYTVLIQKQFSV